MEVRKSIAQFGDQISQKSLVQLRRLLDESIDANKGFVKEKITNFADKAEKIAANSIRRELAKKNPDLARLNAEYSLWTNTTKVVKSTLERRSTQTGGIGVIVARGIGASVGAGVGDSLGDRVTKGAIGFFLGKKAIEFFRSPAYRTLSAVQKNTIADLMVKGEFDKILFFISKFMSNISRPKDIRKE